VVARFGSLQRHQDAGDDAGDQGHSGVAEHAGKSADAERVELGRDHSDRLLVLFRGAGGALSAFDEAAATEQILTYVSLGAPETKPLGNRGV
jgi:hypothetical protein